MNSVSCANCAKNITTEGFTAEQVHELVRVAVKERDKMWAGAVMGEPDTHLWERIFKRFNDSRPNPDPALQPLKVKSTPPESRVIKECEVPKEKE